MGSGGEIMAGNGWWRQNYGYSWMVLGGGGEIMSARRWLQVVTAKLWLVVGGGDKINDWSWVVVDGCGWSWMVARFSNAIFISQMCITVIDKS